MGVSEKIAEIEFEMARTQKNKATEHHLGMLKAKLAKLQHQLLEQGSAKGPKGEGFDVARSGSATVALIGFPSVGKSSLLASITDAKSEAAAYEFTTLTTVPGIMRLNDSQIQVLDLPGIIENAADGKGRGRQVIAVSRTADLVLMMLDAQKATYQRERLTYEMWKMGIRLNEPPPDVTITKRKYGGFKFNSIVKQSVLTEDLARKIAHTYRLFHCEILVREDITVDQFIDALEGNRVYIPCLYVVNKADAISIAACEHFAALPDTVLTCVKWASNLDFLKQRIWEKLGLIRIYLKKKGEPIDPIDDLLILKNGSSVTEVCRKLHRDLADSIKSAKIWGTSVKHEAQRVGMGHIVEDGDVITLIK
ncbi:GTP-binding protein 1 [Aduncisulcus paluster]|uniref:GTP-binding protein 1 n=1 Tax=Aduncisulcus paluster TaxID=2918883 RepID=A0ABQ5KRK7_9EUKA|nr:GTP-binding protein 1 [Aduncisulcus paluster]|eukprot:gnl/Carplike_NY0171/7224_a9971_241.p1 GENE.gnl/Carplike_NY0171/7224_a9971_241~~gnl/Carplike_NY0171/7224_a9971_241.p1  ORF type:complete len:365 (-),score=58.00 gnl/Carplike_NY0171/7224_a9971_241:209-1303(-)